jgi:hypothetical protein
VSAVPVIVPFPLACCEGDERCLLCAPRNDTPSLAYIEALVQRYREDRGEERELVAGFYGGRPPTDAELDACGLPAIVRVRPDLLDRHEASRLRQRGVTRIELDALSFDDRVLHRARRRYRGALVEEICEGLSALGFEVGITLSPGLYGSSIESCRSDAHRAARLVDTARLHPALVLEGSGLQGLFDAGLYQPLTVPEAVGVCLEMSEILEAAGVLVLRIGQQPTPDGLGRSVAGPAHPSLRQLVEAQRTLRVLHTLLASAPSMPRIAIRCAPQDETRTRGPMNNHIRELRADHGLAELGVVPDPELDRGCFRIEPLEKA